MGKHISSRWPRYSDQQTHKENGSLPRKKFFAQRNYFINLTLPQGTNQRDHLTAVAQALVPPVAIDRLPDRLADQVSIRAKTIFRSAADYFEEVANNHELKWWFSEKGLVMGEVRRPPTPRQKFDIFAGKLMMDAPRQANGRISPEEYLRIANALDAKQFGLLEHLEAGGKERVKKWNENDLHPRIRKFAQAMTASAAAQRIKRILMKRLYRAQAAYKAMQALQK